MAKKNKPQRVKPKLLKGFRDYNPSEQIAREKILATARESVEMLGFLPLQTASLEAADILLGSHYNEDSLSELFGFTGPDEIDIALRYEFTVSLARYVAGTPNLPLPFRRYQYGTCWRIDKPAPGRYREFMQFDLDIVGTSNLLADAEIIAAMVTILQKLNIDRFEVRFSNRKILNGLIEWAGIPVDRGPDVMRVLDKLEKQGKDAVVAELGEGRIDDSGDKIKGLLLETTHITSLNDFIDGISKSDKDNPLGWVKENIGEIQSAKDGIEELELIQSYLKELKIDDEFARIDLTIVRGLGYYTGPVFETTLLDLPEYGSIFSGGRYDNLLNRFQSQAVPAVGTSMGPDRLLAALMALNKIKLERATSKVLVTVMDKDRISDYLEILNELRENKIPSEIFTGETKNLTKQVKYADKVGIQFAVIAGSDEFERNEITVKNLTAGAGQAEKTENREEWLKAEGFQETIKRSDLISYIKSALEANH